MVVTDLGRFKAYRLQEDKNFSTPRLELIEDWETNVNHHLREDVTDQAGNYRKGTSNGEGATAMSDGEQHNIDLERRRRALKVVTKRLVELLGSEDVEGCYLAADNQINKAIMAELDDRTRARIQKNVQVNLTRLSQAQVLDHFCEKA